MIIPPAAQRILVKLAWQDAANLAPCLLPAARTGLRDAVIRMAIAKLYATMPRARAAQALAADLASAPQPGTLRADACDAIRALNDGRALAWRRIHDIAAGAKSSSQIGSLRDSAQIAGIRKKVQLT